MSDNPIVKLNLALAAALGVADATNVSSIELKVRPARLPELTVTYSLRAADGMHSVADTFELRPVEHRDAA